MGLDGRGANVGGVSYGRGWEQGSTTINDGNWHFVVMTCNANNTHVSYVDGNVDAWSEDTWAARPAVRMFGLVPAAKPATAWPG